MSHVDEGRLHAFLDGALSAADPADAERVELHLAACADCRARLDEATRLRDQASALLGAAQPRVAATPSFDTIVARAAALDGEGGGATSAVARDRRRRVLLTSPFNGFAWAATIVVAVGLGWMLRDNIESGDRVALNESSADALDRAPESVVVEETASLPTEQTADLGTAGQEALADAPAGFQSPSPSPVASGPVTPQDLRAGAATGTGTSGARSATGDYDVVEEELAVAPPGELAAQPAPEPARRLEAQRSPAPPPPAAPPVAADMAVAGAAEADDGWRTVSLAEAERFADGGIVRLPGARIARVDLRAGSAEVRTVQITGRGETLELIQRRAPERDERSAGEADAMAESAEAAAANSAKPAATVHVGDWAVTITGAAQARLDELARSLD